MLERLAGHQLDVDATVCEETDHVPCMVVHSEPDKHGAWHQAGGVVGPAGLLLVPRSEGLASVRSVPPVPDCASMCWGMSSTLRASKKETRA
jgi:hypothetical protein